MHVFGALGFDTVITKMSQEIDANKFLAFLKKLNKRYKKLCIILDNARCHLTKHVQKYVNRNCIKMVRLLPYSPELNPIERYWKNIKQWLGTKPFFSKKELVNELKKALRKNIFMPKISDY